ncbi:hypothetical protein Pfo_000298 [Paulownia fortunei]|nr:hypothetical protein Pfo_000298 [Paulownia fortunei]
MNEINAFHMVPRACTVCKHHWKICNRSCIFARYFPYEKAEDFQNVHRLFGIQITMKILNSVVENKRDKTVESLILEARIRKENPVHGPVEVQMRLQVEIEQVKKELDMVEKQVQFFRGNEQVLVQQEVAALDEQADQPATQQFAEKYDL